MVNESSRIKRVIGGVYRIFRDRTAEQWFIDAIVD
jgi:hypothetical protein